MDCREFNEMMESYIGDELLIETNHDMMRHLETCSPCRRDMRSASNLRRRLRHLVKNDPKVRIDAVFMSRTNIALKETALATGFWDRFFSRSALYAVGFACLLLVGLSAILLFTRPGRKDLALNEGNSAIVKAVRSSWGELVTLAGGDHENCAVRFHLKEDPISLEEAAGRFGSYNKDLDKVIMAALKSAAGSDTAKSVEFIEAHSCIFEGRRFAHVVVKQNGQVISLLMTDTDLSPADDEIQTTRLDGTLNAAGFLAGPHAVFVVSQLAGEENAALAKTIAPAIRSHVGKLTM